MKIFLPFFLFPSLILAQTSLFDVNEMTLECRDGNLVLNISNSTLPGTIKKSALQRDLAFQSDCEMVRSQVLQTVSGNVALPFLFSDSHGQNSESFCDAPYPGSGHCEFITWCTIQTYDVVRETIAVDLANQKLVGRFEKKLLLRSERKRFCN
jgi:hypothetical protein